MIKPIFLNSAQIAEAVGIGKKEIPRYVKDYDMPAYKEERSGRWRARYEELDAWAIEYTERLKKNAVKV